jgi:hypothetical protein
MRAHSAVGWFSCGNALTNKRFEAEDSFATQVAARNTPCQFAPSPRIIYVVRTQ